MKKLYTLGAMLVAGAMAMSAGAQGLGQATAVGGNYVLSLENATFTWDFQEIELVESMNQWGYDVSTTSIAMVGPDNNQYNGFVVLTTVSGQSLGGGGNDNLADDGIMVLFWDPDLPTSDGMNLVPGDYTVTIPAGVVRLKSDNSVVNVESTIVMHVLLDSYTVGDVDPASGGTYLASQLSEVSVTYGNYSLSYGDGYIYYDKASNTQVDGGFGPDVKVIPESNYKFEGGKLTLDLSFIDEPDTYNFAIPTGFAILDGNKIGYETTFTYTISAVPTFPEASQVTQEYSEKPQLVINYDLPVSLAEGDVTPLMAVNDYFFKNATQIEKSQISIFASEDDILSGNTAESGSYVVFNLSGNLGAAQSNQEIWVKTPKGLFVDAEGKVNPEQSFSFTYNHDTNAVEAIEGVESLAAPVYNLQGIKVADSIENAPAGLYIVNGKKVILNNK